MASASARAWALWSAGLLALYLNDYEPAEQSFAAALALFRPLGDELGEASSLLMLGIVAEDTGAYDRAEALLAKARVLSSTSAAWPIDASPRLPIDSIIAYHQGVVAWGQGNSAAAIALLEEARRAAATAGSAFVVAYALTILGLIAYEQDNLARAAALLGESLTRLRSSGEIHSVPPALAGIAAVAVASDQAVRAARLFGAVDAQAVIIGATLKFPELALFDRATDTARIALGESGFADAWEAGRRLSFDDAVAEAVALAEEIAARGETGAGS